MTTLPATLSLSELEALDPGSGNGSERRYLCPLCGPAHRQDAAHRSLAVNLSSGAYLCHRCGAAGLLAEHQTEHPRPVRAGRAPTTRRHQPPELELAPASGPTPWAHLHLMPIAGSPGEAYLASRGLPAPLPPGTDVRWCPDFGPGGKLGRPAVVFAVRDGSGAAVAVQGRFLDGGSPKAMTLGPVSHGLFAGPGALHTEVWVVCEAPIDALALGAAGVSALATCGSRSSWPAWFAERLAGKALLLAQDADEAGDRQAAALGHAAAKAGATVFRLRPPAKDWALAVEQRGWPALREALTEAMGTGEPPQSAQEPPGPTPAPPVAAKAHSATGGVSVAKEGDLCRVCGAASGHDHWYQGWICRRCWSRVAASIGTDEAGSSEVPVPPDPPASDGSAHGLSDADRASLVDAGLILGRCDACGQEDTLPRSKPTRPCRMTVKCEGRVRSISTGVPGPTRGCKQEQGETQ